MRTLFDDIRTDENMFSAWRHVKRSALNSDKPEIRGKASEFEYQHQRHIKRIQTQLREGRFEFDGVEGVLKDKKAREAVGKDPRPIAIGTIKNRLVQRAILQVLQPRKVADVSNPNSKFSSLIDRRLGKLNDVNRSQFGVGGLMSPYGGVQPAIKLVMGAMKNGASYYFQSDIKAFFTAIPTNDVVATIKNETSDERLTALFEDALNIQLSNPDELAGYAKLFPSGGIGVAQGSSLSAFAGNVLLYDFDHKLNAMNVSAVRYIDDIFVLSESEDSLNQAIEYSKKYLSEYGFSLYKPVAGSDKAAQGLCRDSFNFLGCTIQPNRCVPSIGSVKKTIVNARDALNKSKKEITEYVNGGESFDAKLARSTVLDRLGRRLYGWEKSFVFCTNRQPFNSLDEKISKIVHDYEMSVSRIISKAPINIRMKVLGIPSTEELFIKDRQKILKSKR
jgi:retron-type reverse transcriptase